MQCWCYLRSDFEYPALNEVFPWAHYSESASFKLMRLLELGSMMNCQVWGLKKSEGTSIRRIATFSPRPDNLTFDNSSTASLTFFGMSCWRPSNKPMGKKKIWNLDIDLFSSLVQPLC